jgi:hypothetical protein
MSWLRHDIAEKKEKTIKLTSVPKDEKKLGNIICEEEIVKNRLENFKNLVTSLNIDLKTFPFHCFYFKKPKKNPGMEWAPSDSIINSSLVQGIGDWFDGTHYTPIYGVADYSYNGYEPKYPYFRVSYPGLEPNHFFGDSFEISCFFYVILVGMADNDFTFIDYFLEFDLLNPFFRDGAGNALMDFAKLCGIEKKILDAQIKKMDVRKTLHIANVNFKFE